LTLLPRPLFAVPRPQVVIEIDSAAERWVDARATRRLILLELSDVELPAPVAAPRRSQSLFMRVLGSEGGLVRVELWERGEFHGGRRLSLAEASSQLAARRVALAAAELARQLRYKRLAQRERVEREERRQRLLAARKAERTLDGPHALRSGVDVLGLPQSELVMAGPKLTFELNLSGPFRVDLGAEWLFGSVVDGDTRLSALGLLLAPSRRVVLGRALDLDLGVELALSSVHFDRVLAVDAIGGQSETWTARAGAAARLQLRMSRNLRFGLGPRAGAVLRRMPIELMSGDRRDLGGVWLGAELGIVITPG
jgi:hypothetical protein